MEKEKQIVNSKQFSIMIERLACQLIENHVNFEETVLVGIQPRGVNFSKRILQKINKLTYNTEIQSGSLDITFFRDDFGRRDVPIEAQELNMNFSVEGKRVV